MHILFLSRWFPYPTDNGAKKRIYHILQSLSKGKRVSLISFTDGDLHLSHKNAMLALCDRLVTIPYRTYQPDSLRSVLGLFSPDPRSVRDTFNQDYFDIVTKWVQDDPPAVVIASEIDMVPYALGAGHFPLILEELEVGWLFDQLNNEKTLAGRVRRWMTFKKTQHYIRRFLPRFEACTVVSEPEKNLVHKIAPNYSSIHIVPNGVDVGRILMSNEQPEKGTMVYAGSLTYGANFDAMDYFVTQILPLIRKSWPEAVLRITGSYQGVDLNGLADQDGVELTGYLEDVRPVVGNSRVSVIPIRHGGGTRLKILESLALGTPVVSTRKGAEGLELVHGEEILIADQPEEFSKAVLTLFEDDDLWEHLSKQGRRAVELNYDWSSVTETLLDLIKATTSNLSM